MKPTIAPTLSVRSRFSAGFTLIELLVVIAIIAILAAILFPVFAQAREKARQITCVSNMKQVGLGIMQYVQDYDETYPLCEFHTAATATDNNTSYDWTYAINPYVKNGTLLNNDGQYDTYKGGVYSCPSYPVSGQPSQYVVRADVFPWYSSSAPGNTSSPVVKLALIDAPANEIALWEAGADPYTTWGQIAFNADEYAWTSTVNAPYNGETNLADAGDRDSPAGNPQGYWMAGYQLPRYRHTLTSNFLFLDGHVKAIHKGGLNWATNINIPGICDYTYSGSWSGCGNANPY